MFIVHIYNNGSHLLSFDEPTLDEAFETSVVTLRQGNCNACYIYSESGALCFHLTHSGLFGEKE